MSPTYFFLFLLGGYMHAQVYVSGVITAAEYGEPLPFVNIGIPNKGVGTVSNENGFYQLDILNQYTNDKLRFSMVGHNPQEILISTIEKNNIYEYNVELTQETTALSEVVVTKGTWKEVSVGNKTESKLIVAGFTSNQLGNEIAQFVRVKKNKPIKVQAFWLAIADNKIESVVLRLNFYNEENGFPSENILEEPIYLHLPNEAEKITVDLIPYDIYTEDNFFVSLEWIEDLGIENLWFSASVFGKSLYVRSASQGKWIHQKALGIGMGVELLQKQY